MSECVRAGETSEHTWVVVTGIHQEECIVELSEGLGLHPLVIEDILDTGQRPKVDDVADYLYIVIKALDWDDTTSEVIVEQLSIVLGPRFLVSFTETDEPAVNLVRKRLRDDRGHLRENDGSALAYALIDAVVDGYFLVLEKLSDRVEDIHDEVLGNPSSEILSRMHELKRSMARVRSTVWPVRESLSVLSRGEHPLVSSEMVPYLRDVYDNIVQVIDNVEVQREVIAGMFELYLSSVSNRMNEIMKVLTIISTVFIPLTFVAGVYGMNFDHMPELPQVWGYPAILLVMATIAGFELRWFRRKGWI